VSSGWRALDYFWYFGVLSGTTGKAGLGVEELE